MLNHSTPEHDREVLALLDTIVPAAPARLGMPRTVDELVGDVRRELATNDCAVYDYQLMSFPYLQDRREYLYQELRRVNKALGDRGGLFLVSYPEARKLDVIKLIRDLGGFGLREAKNIAEGGMPALLLTGTREDFSANPRMCAALACLEQTAVIMWGSPGGAAERLAASNWGPSALTGETAKRQFPGSE